ncbi:EamA family transporter [Streptomyces sp. 184]|uniref:EamA family transporter n=1 Tax=Streptomyces sp. 184 TaxID=1827526 RepID=UPI0038922FC3
MADSLSRSPAGASGDTPAAASGGRFALAAERVPPPAFLVSSAVFHYLGPACAVLLFARLDVLAVTWLRIASAALVFAVWRRPWRDWRAATPYQRKLLVAMGAVLATMNGTFYLALERLPLGTVGAVEFLGPVVLAAAGVRTRRNVAALALVLAGVALLTDAHLVAEPLGLALAFGNCALFVLYVVLGHRLAADGGASGVGRLGAAMLVAAVVAAPAGIGEAAAVVTSPVLLAAAFGVGVCSSVIPYVCDQLAMARVPRATFALMLSLLPATAALMGVVVLGQVPGVAEAAGIALVVAGVAVHRERDAAAGA